MHIAVKLEANRVEAIGAYGLGRWRDAEEPVKLFRRWRERPCVPDIRVEVILNFRLRVVYGGFKVIRFLSSCSVHLRSELFQSYSKHRLWNVLFVDLRNILAPHLVNALLNSGAECGMELRVRANVAMCPFQLTH